MSILTTGILQSGLQSNLESIYSPSGRTFQGASFAKIRSENATSIIDISHTNGMSYTSYDLTAVISGGTRVIKSFDYQDEKVVISSYDAGIGANNYILHISNDYGVTFTNLTANLPFFSANENNAISDVSYYGGRLFAHAYSTNYANYKFIYSDDNGLTWTTVTTVGGQYSTSFILLSTINNGLSILNGGVVAWNSAYRYNTTVSTIIDFVGSTEETSGGYAEDIYQNRFGVSKVPGSSNMFYTAYKNWSHSNTYIYSHSTITGVTEPAKIHITTSDQMTIGAASETVVITEHDGTVYRSTNAGTSFTSVATLTTQFIKFLSPTVGTLGSSTGMYYTNDGGQTWNRSNEFGQTTSAYIIRSNVK